MNVQINDDLADIMIEPTPSKKKVVPKPQIGSIRSNLKVSKTELSSVSYREEIKNQLTPQKVREEPYNFVTKKKPVVKDILNVIAPTKVQKKQWTFYVYKGNYPHHIENALLKRGVWKVFDKYGNQGQNLKQEVVTNDFNDLESLKARALANI